LADAKIIGLKLETYFDTVPNASQHNNFTIGYGISNPQNNPILYAQQTIRLQIANGNEWYCATNAANPTSNSPSAVMISMHDIVANNGLGPVGFYLINRNVRDIYTLRVGSITVTLPAFLISGDIFSLTIDESLNGGVDSYLTALNTNQNMVYKVQTDSILNNLLFTVTKVDTSLTTCILQNDLVYIHCQAFGQTYYLQTGNSAGTMYMMLDSHPCYCRFDYAEVQ